MIKNKKIGYIIFIGIFLLMLVCNGVTDLVADDFAYCYDFRNGEKITGFFQIFGSMKGHAFSMNGRLCAHFLAQLFLLLPKWIFNVVNAFSFTAMIAFIYKIAWGKKTNNAAFLGVFASVWVFAPVFGQIFLWLDGSCNYLWSYVLGLLFVLPYTKRFIQGEGITKVPLKILFWCLCLVMGAYSENASPAFICVATLLLLADVVFFKIRPKAYEIVGILLSVVGYITIYLSPAQLTNKSATLTVANLRGNLAEAVAMYLKFAPVLVVFAVMLVLAFMVKADRKKIWMALSFFIGSLLSNFMMIVASYYHDRSSGVGLILLLIATFILLHEVLTAHYKIPVYTLIVTVLLCAVYFGWTGIHDIFVTHQAIERNEQVILESKQQGDLDIQLPLVVPQTKYSAVYGLRYLSDETTQTWPNVSMSKYYGVNSIIGE